MQRGRWVVCEAKKIQNVSVGAKRSESPPSKLGGDSLFIVFSENVRTLNDKMNSDGR